ncbi:MAG: tetratricopeptide repeat protein [Bacteroidia bacterium]|nr:tetratricopeptide repeat protein [Bacteroidia bacterium]
MSFFPSDWDDEDEEEFNGNVEELVKEFEGHQREDFTPRELLEIFRYYSMDQLFTGKEANGKAHMKMVLELGMSQFPYIPVFTLHMCEILMGEKNYRLARKYLSQAREYNAFEPALFFMEAVVLSLEGRPEKAMDMMRSGMELAADDEETLEDFLELLLFYGRFEMALPVLEKALSQGQDVSYILEKWLDISTDKDHIEKLLPLLEKMVDENPYSEDAWYLTGTCYLELENHEKAAWAFDYAITINENFLEAWTGYLESLYEISKYEEFVKHITEQSKRFSGSAFEDLQGLYAWSLYETGSITDSRALYRKILKKNPQDSESWYSMGLTWHYEQNYSAAIPYLERAYELNPVEADYGIVLAAAYFGVSATEKWEALYDILSQEHPEEEEIYLDWGIALHETGETDRALEITQQGLKQNPNSYKLMYRLASICYLTGQHPAAEYLLETALSVNAEEHAQMFIFAPELKKAGSLLRIIARYINPGL